MAPKRKASMGMPSDENESHQSAQPPLEKRRRSNRHRPLNDVKEMDTPGVSMRPSSPPNDLDASLSANIEVNRQVWESREGVRRAMKELCDMEERLQAAVKRQRLAIEDSDIRLDLDLPIQQRSRHSPSRVPRSESRRVSDGVRQGGHAAARLKTSDTEVKPEPSSNPPGQPSNSHPIISVGASSSAGNDGDRGAARPPAVNSDYLPLPWKGRLGYACLNTYLRAANPPVFSSRTCRIASILQHRHPLKDPSLPEHPTKNRPDESKPPNVKLGQRYVEELGLANARDIAKMLRWNDKFGIKFMRLSSEMFPFASHEEYGYALAPFASEVLAEAGAVAAELGHRVTMHPGQFTQLGSPRAEVVAAAIRDLAYHDELLSLLNLPTQQDRDAVLILHMGGTYGDKDSTIERFRANYGRLPESLKRRLVLENDDVSWTVHDLLPVCEDLNIPLVLDFHHHNIMFDSSAVKEGTRDIVSLFPRIRATWTRKAIRPKMHYSEACVGCVTPRDRRKHSPRVKTLPPCANDMDLMIEAKDKEQAVFELMRTFKLPGHNLFADMVPYEREDEMRKVDKGVIKPEAKTAPKAKKRNNATGKRKGRSQVKQEDSAEESDAQEEEEEEAEVPEIRVTEASIVSPKDFGMGGPLGRVYWPEGMEAWLKPMKKEVKKRKGGAAGDEEE